MEANAALNKAAGKWVFENTEPEVVRLENGYLESAGNFFYYLTQPDETVAEFSSWVEETLNCPYLYIQAPAKLCALDQEEQLPLPEMTNANQQTDWLLEHLAELGVDTLDLRESLHADGLNHYDCFYVTDHHWTMDTGLWAADVMAAELEERYGLAMDMSPLNPEKYEQRVWEDAFLGSQGRKVTLSYAHPEDFILPVPTFATDLHLTVPPWGSDFSGGFEILYNESAIPSQPGEKISAMVQMREFEDDKYLIMATKNGTIKKTPINAYTNIRKSGIQAITLREGDELIDVTISDNTHNIMLVTKNGQGIKFRETDVRETGRSAMGVRGIELKGNDEVISMQIDTEGEYILIVSANGMGKRTPFTEFKLQNRGGKGVKCYKITEKTGEVVGAKAVNDGNEIMMITNEGIVIRMFVDDISVLGRVTLGVKLMNTGNKDDIVVASITKVKESVTQADAEEAERLEAENSEETDEENSENE